MKCQPTVLVSLNVLSKHTNNVDMAERLLASVFFFPSVINFSASLCASFALCHVVEMDSCSMRDVTRLRRSALRCAESLLRCRYFVRPPAIAAVCGGSSF